MQERAEHVAVPERRVVRHLADPGLAPVADPDVDLERLAARAWWASASSSVYRSRRLRWGAGSSASSPGCRTRKRSRRRRRRGHGSPTGRPTASGKPVEQGAEPLRTAAHRGPDERPVRAPGLRLELEVAPRPRRQIRAFLPARVSRTWPAGRAHDPRRRRAHVPGTTRTCGLSLRRAALYPRKLPVGEPVVPHEPPPLRHRDMRPARLNLRPVPPQGSALSPELRARGGRV